MRNVARHFTVIVETRMTSCYRHVTYRKRSIGIVELNQRFKNYGWRLSAGSWAINLGRLRNERSNFQKYIIKMIVIILKNVH